MLCDAAVILLALGRVVAHYGGNGLAGGLVDRWGRVRRRALAVAGGDGSDPCWRWGVFILGGGSCYARRRKRCIMVAHDGVGGWGKAHRAAKALLEGWAVTGGS